MVATTEDTHLESSNTRGHIKCVHRPRFALVTLIVNYLMADKANLINHNSSYICVGCRKLIMMFYLTDTLGIYFSVSYGPHRLAYTQPHIFSPTCTTSLFMSLFYTFYYSIHSFVLSVLRGFCVSNRSLLV